ncbi:MAG: hypothetical protein U5J95_03800 [Balneolaceae bacterium]|nr:hypothetical protein [Balneolaceae bacterium]
MSVHKDMRVISLKTEANLFSPQGVGDARNLIGLYDSTVELVALIRFPSA